MRNGPNTGPNNSHSLWSFVAILLIIIVCSAIGVFYWDPFSVVHSSVSDRGPGIIRWTQDHLYDLHFINQDKGWVVGDYGTILTTENSGKSWIRQDSGTKALLRSVDFVSEKEGWAVGVRGTVLHTRDGGQTWIKKEIDTRLLHSLDPDIYLRDVDFIDAAKGWIIARTGFIFVTDDGGKNWHGQALGGKEARLNRIRFFTKETGWIVGEFGSLFSTRDGGKSWQPKESGTEVTLMDIGFHDANLGYVAGLSGTILRTRDGGDTWEKIPTGRKENFFNLSINKETGDVFVLGNRFFQWFTIHSDKKLDWHQFTLPANVNLLETWLYSGQLNADNGLWVVGREGIVLHCSNDGGNCQSLLNWKQNVHLVE